MGPQQCNICREAESKYKCPACLIPYCSLACFKKHKVSPCVNAKPVLPDEEPKKTSAEASGVTSVSADKKPISPCVNAKPVLPDEEPKKTSAEVSSVSADKKPKRPIYVDKPCEVLEKAQLESLVASSEIRDALKNEDLQKLIHNIDSSPNPGEELEKAMGVDMFRIFSDKVLSAANP